MTNRPPTRGSVRIFGFLTVGFAALIGLCCSGIIGTSKWVQLLGLPVERSRIPLPHQVPLIPGGTSLRIAMVHDVVHQRYPVHGEAYWSARLAKAEATIAALPDVEGVPIGSGFLDALDVAAVAHDKLGRPDEGARVMERKLALQHARGAPREIDVSELRRSELGRRRRELEREGGLDEDTLALYRTHANLGTFLLHGGFKAAVGGDPDARAQLGLGLRHVKIAITLNPGAHFGRETWQACFVAHLRSAFEKPEQLLLRYDVCGEKLAKGRVDRDARMARSLTSRERGLIDLALTEEADLELNESARFFITQVGANLEWVKRTRGIHASPVAFDEPVLGILGMWTLGGGANPHSALALGNLMERVGQRAVAWACYERAARLEARFWPDEAVRKGFLQHLRSRQKAIIAAAGADEDAWRKKFDAELAHGLAWQEARMAYEAERIAAGADPEADDFYEAFDAEHGSIASPPGGIDWIDHAEPALASHLLVLLLFAGLFAAGGALLVRFVRLLGLR